MDVACCQLDIAWEDKPANYRRVEQLVAAAHLPPGTLLLLPEMFATGFTMNASQVAEAVDGPTSRFLAELARRHGIVVQAGVVLSDGQAGKPRNEALVFGGDGQLLARYAKLHLFSYAREPDFYAAGDAPTTYDLQALTVAPAICYDLRFPELFRAMIPCGVAVIAVIACWPAPREEHWLSLLKARAIENQCYVAAVNRCGKDPTGLAYSGRSQIIDPHGRVLADAGNGQRVIQSVIDLDALHAYRREFPALSDMRSDCRFFRPMAGGY